VIDFDRFDALTFDCYGTLIDWESGIAAAARRLLAVGGAEAERAPEGDAVRDPEAILTDFARLESAAEAPPFRPYRDVLREVGRGLARSRGLDVSDEAVDRFAASVPDWPPFGDTVSALSALSGRYRLAVVSNVDDDLFAGTAARLGVRFDTVVTAQQVRSYKPGHAHFDEVLRRLDLPRDRVLHVAQSLHHDIAPARALGFTCVWVDRRRGRDGAGATPPAEASADLVVPDLETLANTSLG